MPPAWGFLAAGLGSALADILSGYAIYGPATLLIKGLMALVAFYGFKMLHNKCGKLVARIISGIAAEVVMIVGYFIFVGFLYGFGPAAVNIPANAVQGVAGIIIEKAPPYGGTFNCNTEIKLLSFWIEETEHGSMVIRFSCFEYEGRKACVVNSLRIILCFQAEGITWALYTAFLANVSFTHIIGSIEMDTRHSCVYLHCDSGQIRSRNCGWPKKNHRTVYHIIWVISFCLHLFRIRIFDMCFDGDYLPQVHRCAFNR